jgi:hypothetical protein
MTWKYKTLALGAGFAAALALSACGRHRGPANTEGTAPTAEAPAATSAPAQGAQGTTGGMGAETSAPATSSPPAG